MPTYGNKSEANLATCHPELQVIFRTVVQYFDNSIIFGYREISLQQELFEKGRKLQNGIWVVENKKKIVTYCDGIIKKSDHNIMPSLAIDAVPYPSLYSDKDKLIELGGFVKGIAKMLLKYGQIDHEIIWGGNWRWKDYPHYQLKL